MVLQFCAIAGKAKKKSKITTTALSRIFEKLLKNPYCCAIIKKDKDLFAPWRNLC
jgi:hypothetical protein